MITNMSILTSEEASSLSSCNMNNDTSTGAFFCPPHQQHLVTHQYQNPPQQIKKKRNQPGHPDPEAEVIALSPKTLVATNRFFCEICNKGFQRDQNLQLHRRGHNLPWKLKKRENKEVVRKKVYICPMSSCVHHDPSRALGDLTGIKKHFSRKHGEKKWKCEKCSKHYAVQSDCKAHFKTCGTREYKCECGTIFSRRDSFITHRAFCDTLAVENARISASITRNPTLSPSQMNLQFQKPHYFNSHDQIPATFSMKKEQPSSDFRHIEIPPWLMTNCQPFAGVGAGLGPPPRDNFSSSSVFFPATARLDQQYTQSHKDLILHENPNPNLQGSTFEDAVLFSGFSNLNSKKEEEEEDDQLYFNRTLNEEDMTKDFLGLRPLSHNDDIFNIAGLVNSSTEHDDQFKNHKTWQN